MNKVLIIYLISILLLCIGCNKHSDNIQENSTIIQDNISNNNETILQLDILSEDGDIIQNAQIPKSEWEGVDEITSVKADDNIPMVANDNDINVFFRAIYDNDTVKISEFLKNGFDINIMNKNGENAIYVAIASGNYYVLQFLIDNGANVNNTSDDGLPPLSQAILEYDNTAIDMLLSSNKVDMYYVWGDMWTGSPLYIACSKANVYALEKMMEKGADLNYDFSDYNALALMHYALSYKTYLKNEEYKELIAFLILNKININARNGLGQTPLMKAIINVDIDAFNALIAGGADITLKDNNGMTALDYAKSLKSITILPDNEYKKIINLLLIDNKTK